MPLMTIKDVAQILKVTPRTVSQICKEGELRSILVGNRRRIDSADLQRYLAANYQGKEPQQK